MRLSKEAIYLELDISKLKECTLEKYDNVLNKNKKWENGYWDSFIGKERARICIVYLCENILKFQNNDYESRISKYMFTKYKLGNMLNKVYEGVAENAVIDAIPKSNEIIYRRENRVRIEGDIAGLMLNIDSRDVRKEIAEKLIDYLDCSQEDIPKSIDSYLFFRLPLNDMLKRYYDDSIYKFIEEVRPGVFKPWEFEKRTTMNNMRFNFIYSSNAIPREYFQDKNNRFEAVMWLFDKLKEQGRKAKDFSVEEIVGYGLITLMGYYNNSVFSMIDEFFEGKMRPWQFKETGSKEYWNNNSNIAKEGVLLVINKLGLAKDNVVNLTSKDFKDNYLDDMLYENYNGFIFSAIDSVYPNEFNHLKWFFNDIPEEVFDVKENRQEAIQALVKKLGVCEDNIPYAITKEILIDNGFNYIFNTVHKCNIFLVINEVFPDKFNKKDFYVLPEYVEEYIDLFKDFKYSKLSFLNTTDEEIKTGIAKLGQIFTVNTNSWIGEAKPKPFVEKIGDLEVLIYQELVKGNISIYEFEQNEPKEPENKIEESMYDRLAHHSRAKYSNIVWLYWRAYNFFKFVTLHLQLDSVYMKLGKDDYPNRMLHYGYNDSEKYSTMSTIEKYESIVRCGELEVDRLYTEVLYGADCVWVFPFEEERCMNDIAKTNKYKAYLIQFNHDSKVLLNNNLNKPIII